MKFRKFSAWLILAILTISSGALAENIRMIFWYPGEAGSTELAQPALDLFFGYINSRTAPDKIDGRYFNTVNDGLSFIRSASPKLGILSFAAFEENREKIGRVSILLKTLPLPGGKSLEQYVIVGKGEKPKSWNINLYSRQPLTAGFVNKYVLPGTAAPKIAVVPAILPTLKEVSSGKMPGGVILQPIEFFTLKNLNQDWAKELKTWSTSPPVPTASLLLFGDTLPVVEKIKTILLNMEKDPEGKDILNELRLKGFELTSND